jgi:hypothetical protein
MQCVQSAFSVRSCCNHRQTLRAYSLCSHGEILLLRNTAFSLKLDVWVCTAMRVSIAGLPIRCGWEDERQLPIFLFSSLKHWSFPFFMYFMLHRVDLHVSAAELPYQYPIRETFCLFEEFDIIVCLRINSLIKRQQKSAELKSSVQQ